MTAANSPETAKARIIDVLRIGLIAGVAGSITIWIYEYFVLFKLLHQSDTAAGVVRHTALLVFGPGPLSSGNSGFMLGALIHCVTGVVWAIAFAAIWPSLAEFKIEATLAGLAFGAFAWLIMHLVVLALLSPDPPVYTPYAVINGFMSHMVAFAVPIALTVKALQPPR